MQHWDVIIIGAGAAGMMCAAEAGKRGRSVLVLDHAESPGEKIRISGGGRCNFTNIHTSPAQFLSHNPHFCISALSRYTAADFTQLVKRHGIAFHEKTLGQLFCDGSAGQIIDLLRDEMEKAHAVLRLETSVVNAEKNDSGFRLSLSAGEPVECDSLVIATGGKSIPKMGASDFGYRLAAHFGVPVMETRPALVPLVFGEQILAKLKPLAGVSVSGRVRYGRASFDEAILFTHRGLSGPAILQISSYWREGGEILVSMLPHVDLFEMLRVARQANGRQMLATALSEVLLKSHWAASIPERSIPEPWPRNRFPASISSARSSMSPGGWAATISNGHGPPAGAPGRRYSALPLPFRCSAQAGGAKEPIYRSESLQLGYRAHRASIACA